MTFEARNIKPEDLGKDGLAKLINRDVAELNHLTDDDLLSLWCLFKAICTPPDDENEGTTFITMETSIIWKNREAVEKAIPKLKIVSGREFLSMEW
jgi:hypothetical protein